MSLTGIKPSMLAVDVLTEKLRDQTINEQPKKTSHIKLIQPSDGYKLSKNAEATIAGSGKKVWTVQLNSSTGKDLSETLKQGSFCASSFSAGSPSTNQSSHLTSESGPPLSLPAPPKKRHCRSLVVPIPHERPTPSSWQPQESQLWKPVAVLSSDETLSEATVMPVNFCGSDTALGSRTCECGGAMSVSEHGFVIPGDIFTPPESPVPRPSSTSTCSVRHDGTFSPLGAPWLDQCQRRYDAFQSRSLSFEDQISYSSGSTPSVSGCVHSQQTLSHHHHHYLHHHHHHHHHHRIPRCRSQPSMTHDRKYGLKRRRDYDRPTLNFRKMTETAYQQIPRSESSRSGLKEKRISKFHEELESVMSLMPIASSPMDTDLPIKRMMAARNSPISEMDSGRSDSAEFLDSEGSDSLGEGAGPVKLLGEGCEECEGGDEEVEEIFTLQEDLDLEQIENH